MVGFVTLMCEDANSKLFEVVTVADLDVEKHVNDSLVQIWKLKLSPIAFSPKIVRSNDECPTKCINLVSGHSTAPDHKSSLLKISRLNPATQRSAGCSIIRTFNYLQIENGKNRKWGGFAINSFLFCPENVHLS